MKEVGLEAHLAEWRRIWWVERRSQFTRREKQEQKRKTLDWIWGTASLPELGQKGRAPLDVTPGLEVTLALLFNVTS